MISDFDARFDAAYDLRLYQQAKGYVDASTDAWEYWLWEPQDAADINEDIVLNNASEDAVEEF